MSWFTPSSHPDEKYFIFGKGGGERLATEFGIPLLAQIPVNENVRVSCDGGKMGDLTTDRQVYEAFMKLIDIIT